MNSLIHYFRWLDYIDSDLRIYHVVYGYNLLLYNKVYRKVFIGLWRIKTKIWFPIKFHFLGKIFKGIFNPQKSTVISDEMLKQCVIDFKYSQKHLREQSDEEYQKPVFPMEIWYEISKHMNPVKLIRINKTFCDYFSPLIYKDLQMVLVISDTSKIQKNDLTYMNYGPDLVDNNIDDYGIYLRYREGKNFAYEFLDTTLRDEVGLKADNFEVIYKFSEVKHILIHIINNPNSYLKRYVEQIKLDVSMLSANELDALKNKDGIIYKKIKNELWKSNHCSVFKYYPRYLIFCFTIMDMYMSCRWQLPDLAPFNRDYNNPSLIDPNIAKDIYPKNVYMKELMLTTLLHDFIRDKCKKRNRNKLALLKKGQMLKRLTPFENWHKRTKGMPIVFNTLDEMKLRKTAKYQSRLVIEDRCFETKDFTESLLINTLSSITSNELNGGINCSMSFLGQDLPHESITLIPHNYLRTSTLDYTRPDFVVINKPKKN
ncbi:hypothetical protein BN7_969 [Wickerhamomyces ciferrii]|uniref:F-box domain-containing protein n=1 Tax=Wickerhamomyces ciferrii (strain ATCC 14091 / BCRC 22168 / CBS 111 / JCM 3599 / NBRC 0793 / NRRL Y-1031 F-60-10) TaxID=1206466 RepID=K0KJY1_WICCF|nr:uncharacterized protein BN7_969 [Wickerhamomyces ciferrii]CCH41428.1 hypothetical protein BN7_969 [Wickerhamomyces ciferrii]